MDMLQPTLVTGLTELCRARPEQSETVAWLANWCVMANCGTAMLLSPSQQQLHLGESA
jgi:hypothetical protein